MRWLLPGLVVLQGLTAQAQSSAAAPAAQGPWDQPWDQSVRLESTGDLAGAEAILVSTWGAKPDNFYVQLRLAYLALLARRGREAVARYERTRSFPEAEGDEDTTAGYAAALALRGWELEGKGKQRAARRWWRKALAVRPDQPDALAGLQMQRAPMLNPEVWGSLVGQSLGTGQYQAQAVFAQLPWRPTESLTLRLAWRQIRWRQVSPPSPWAFSEQAVANWTVNELYAGLGYQRSAVRVEGLAFGIAAAGSPTLSGVGVHAALGRQWGIAADAVALFQSGTWANQQARPLLFLSWGGLVPYAGVRITRDGPNLWASAVAGASLTYGSFLAYVDGHLGTERWAVDLASPSVLSIAPASRRGGGITVLWDISRMWRVGGQVTSDALADDGATGWFSSAALGLQLRVFSL
jgi:hypothetical protein